MLDYKTLQSALEMRHLIGCLYQTTKTLKEVALDPENQIGDSEELGSYQTLMACVDEVLTQTACALKSVQSKTSDTITRRVNKSRLRYNADMKILGE